MKINKDSLQARVKNLAEEKSVPSNVILQEFFFDAFLKRLAKSKHKDSFILKGGFLLSVNLGIDYRSTMDMDFLLKKIAFNIDNIRSIFEEIINIDVDDNVSFEFVNINEIRQQDQYGGYSVSLLGRLQNIKVPVNIDVATGDPITPSSIVYQYECMFDNKTLSFASYNYETIISEKLQTILIRGIANSRSKDFYDLYIIYKLKFESINLEQLKIAFINTCDYRRTKFSFEDAVRIINDIKESDVMNDRWRLFSKKNKFANGIDFNDILSSIVSIINIVYNA